MREARCGGQMNRRDTQRVLEEAEAGEGLERLAGSALQAPPDLVANVMRAVRNEPLPQARLRLPALLWPREAVSWVGPSLAGALAALLLVLGGIWIARQSGNGEGKLAIRFQLHAPDAQQVELIGSFNAWQPGEILLTGPDATGHWQASLTLPEGRHEYGFLVDGRKWVADPNAPAAKPDGFGHLNAVLEI